MAVMKKRMLQRYNMEVPVTLSFSSAKKKQNSLELMTRNICSGGAFLETTSPLPLGTPVNLDLVLPLEKFKKIQSKKAHIALSGEVIRAEKNGMAICFHDNFSISPISH